MLSEREYALIKATDPASRYFLIKQGSSAVVAKVNLSGMGNIVSVLSSRAETVTLLDKIIAKHCPNPQVWLPIFYEEVKNVS